MTFFIVSFPSEIDYSTSPNARTASAKPPSDRDIADDFPQLCVPRADER